jgi:hypothetical protein
VSISNEDARKTLEEIRAKHALTPKQEAEARSVLTAHGIDPHERRAVAIVANYKGLAVVGEMKPDMVKFRDDLAEKKEALAEVFDPRVATKGDPDFIPRLQFLHDHTDVIRDVFTKLKSLLADADQVVAALEKVKPATGGAPRSPLQQILDVVERINAAEKRAKPRWTYQSVTALLYYWRVEGHNLPSTNLRTLIRNAYQSLHRRRARQADR